MKTAVGVFINGKHSIYVHKRSLFGDFSPKTPRINALIRAMEGGDFY